MTWMLAYLLIPISNSWTRLASSSYMAVVATLVGAGHRVLPERVRTLWLGEVVTGAA
jgi:hypothetical protein